MELLRTHPPFEELCALATSGELSPGAAELLRAHLTECDDCRMFLREARKVSQALVPSRPVLAESRVPAGMRERFLDRAQRQGLRMEAGPPRCLPVVQEPVSKDSNQEERISTLALLARSWQTWTVLAGACTACLLIGALIRTPLLGKWNSLFVAHPSPVATAITPTLSTDASPLAAPDHERLRVLTAQRNQLAAQIAALSSRIDTLKQDKQASEDSLSSKLAATASSAAEDHEALTKQAQQLSARAADLESQLNTLRQQQTLLEASLHTERARATEYEARLEIAQKTIHESSAGPTPTLASSSAPGEGEVGSLVAARNLHIIDVYDSNSAGKRQRAFGRVFYVEGRSLVFYAFDLSAPKEAKNIKFHLWGAKAGQKETTLSLGVLHDDDPQERRWALTFDDPKILARINSVYVTAESGGKSDQPRGPKVLYAYFGSQPNHP